MPALLRVPSFEKELWLAVKDSSSVLNPNLVVVLVLVCCCHSDARLGKSVRGKMTETFAIDRDMIGLDEVWHLSLNGIPWSFAHWTLRVIKVRKVVESLA
jgi:hypothetical protein